MDVFYPSDFSLIYQWFHDGVEVAGANTETITGVATASDAGAYWVVIGSVAGAITSALAISSPAIGNWHTVTWRSDPFWELVQGGDVAGSFTPVNVPGV